MELISLGIVFLTIILLLTFKRPLWQAISGGLIACAVLFRIAPADIPRQIADVFTDWNSLSVLVSLYLITYLQRMLDSRDQIKLAGRDLNGLFHNRRVNASAAQFFIGLLPSAAAMILCGDIVKDATDGYLNPKEQAFAASWFRHIPESTLPTYSGVLLMANLSGVPLNLFMPAMIVPIITLAALGFFMCLRKLPRDPGVPADSNRWMYAVRLLRHLWSLILILVLILAFGMSVVPAVLISIFAALFVYRFSAKEAASMILSAFEVKLILNTFLVLVLKEFIGYSGALARLPEALAALSAPDWLIFALLFFAGGIVSGTNGIIALGTPLAFAAMPTGGVPLMVLLMCMCHAASQVSPTHVCLVVAADYFHVTLGELVRKTLPAIALFCALMAGYYLLLTLFF